jgi:hypothetical protein
MACGNEIHIDSNMLSPSKSMTSLTLLKPHKGGWSVVNLSLELHESGCRRQHRKLGAGCNIVILVGQDVDCTDGNFVVYYGLVVLAYNINAQFLCWEVSKDSKR